MVSFSFRPKLIPSEAAVPGPEAGPFPGRAASDGVLSFFFLSYSLLSTLRSG